MKVLVVGAFPPPDSPSADRTKATVRALAGDGHDVEVLSPGPSAAHHDAHLSGPLGVLALRRLAPTFDGVVLRLEPGTFLTAHPGRLRFVAEARLLTAALGPWRHVTIEVDALGWFPVGGRAMGAVWAACDRVVLANEDDRRRMQTEAGLAPGKVEVRPPSRRTRGTTTGWDDVSATTVEDVMAEIRVRAAADRRLAAAGGVGSVPVDVPTVDRSPVARGAQLARRVLGPYAEVAFVPLKRVRRLVSGR